MGEHAGVKAAVDMRGALAAPLERSVSSVFEGPNGPGAKVKKFAEGAIVPRGRQGLCRRRRYGGERHRCSASSQPAAAHHRPGRGWCLVQQRVRRLAAQRPQRSASRRTSPRSSARDQRGEKGRLRPWCRWWAHSAPGLPHAPSRLASTAPCSLLTGPVSAAPLRTSDWAAVHRRRRAPAAVATGRAAAQAAGLTSATPVFTTAASGGTEVSTATRTPWRMRQRVPAGRRSRPGVLAASCRWQ